MRGSLVVAVMFGALGLGCEGPGAPDGGAERVPDGAVVGPDGALGVCCPMGTPSCNCTPLGGWAPSEDRCSSGVCDAWPLDFEMHVDEWGCPFWTYASPEEETGCCLCPPDGPDAG